MGAELELLGAVQAWSWPRAQPGRPHLRLPRRNSRDAAPTPQHEPPCSTPCVLMGQTPTAPARQDNAFPWKSGMSLVSAGKLHGYFNSRGAGS